MIKLLSKIVLWVFFVAVIVLLLANFHISAYQLKHYCGVGIDFFYNHLFNPILHSKPVQILNRTIVGGLF